jgi:putative transposase
MPKKRPSPEPIVKLLRQIEIATSQGKSVAIACREAEISDQSCYRWRKENGGLDLDQARRMKDLERENTRLRRLVRQSSHLFCLCHSGTRPCSKPFLFEQSHT